MRINLIRAIFDALKKLDAYKVKQDYESKSGMTTGKVE
jgi:ribosomal protein S5